MKSLNSKTTVRIFSLSFIVLFSCLNLRAQQPGDREELEARRIGFLTGELQLTPDEAKVFWPVYNKYRAEMTTVRKDRETALLSTQINFENMTDEEVSALIENEFNFRQKELDIQKKYNADFRKILPVRKVAKLYRAEQQFKINLIKDMKQPNSPKR